ncbi:MAG: hypothetical protein JSV85_04465 [Candidatus Bathyarchaeota archaeon]|nr:MAG: hypothetical protein JSV85_04465 [Candidatus Bathyarchaeota archaeon]
MKISRGLFQKRKILRAHLVSYGTVNGMRLQAVLGIFMAMFLINIVSVMPVSARPTVGSGAFTASYMKYYPPDFGANAYYGDDMCLEYTVTVHWTSITYLNGDVRQTLTASGTVDVYYLTNLTNSIDTRSCSASLSFYDAGGDACIGEAGAFYEVDWDPSSLQKMERLHHLHQVSGVYVRIAWIRNGVGWGKAVAFTHPPTILIVD